jgi:hypothetical protein
MGGMQVLEWGVMFPEMVRSLVPIASTAAASAQQIAYWSTGRRVIRLDPNWRGGDYYDAPPGDGSPRGPGPGPDDLPDHLPVRRRLHGPLRARGRGVARRLQPLAALPGRALPRVPRRQAGPPVRRQLLPAAQQGHGSARPGARAGAGSAPARRPHRTYRCCPWACRAPTRSTLSTSSGRSSRCSPPTACEATCVEIDSPHGHDGFLIEVDAVGELLDRFLDDPMEMTDA